jgi:integral membrane protein
MMLQTPLTRFRALAIAEGLSYLTLFGVTMPLKYMAGWPAPNKIVGMLHGVLSVLYVILLIQVWRAERWSLMRAAVALIASLVPFGAFAFEWSLRREERSMKG